LSVGEHAPSLGESMREPPEAAQYPLVNDDITIIEIRIYKLCFAPGPE
jgi:hypothetical protein